MVVKNILVMNVNWLGDVLMSAPVFWNLKQHFPQARLVCLAHPRVKDIFSCMPCVDQVIVYDEDGEHSSLFGKVQLIFKLRSFKFDQVYILHKSLTRALISFFAGIPERVGYDTKGRAMFLTRAFKLKEHGRHRLDEYQHLLELCGVPLKRKEVKLSVPEKLITVHLRKLEDLGITSTDYKVLIHPAANWKLKRWPKENFSKLIERLINELKVKVIVTGSKSEEGLVSEIIAPLGKKPVVFVGQTNLPELAALMSQVNVVISADSGPMHLASACCSNVIALFGPTRSEITGARGAAQTITLQHDVGCNLKPCYHLKCPDNICMQAITVEEVIDAVKQIRS